MSHYNKDGPWVQISGKYISIDHGEIPQVFRAATDAEMRLMQHAPDLLAACKKAYSARRGNEYAESAEGALLAAIDRAEGGLTEQQEHDRNSVDLPGAS